MKWFIIFLVLVLVACGSGYTTRVKIVGASTEAQTVYVVYATTPDAEIRSGEIRTYEVPDLEVFNELKNNIGGLYDITVEYPHTLPVIVKADKYNGR